MKLYLPNDCGRIPLLCFFAEVEVLQVFLEVTLIILAVLLILVVLLQKGKSAGLSGAISGGAEQLFGKQKARGMDLFLARLTTGAAVGFFLLSLFVSYRIFE